jgi:multiple sugar transport system ATP-binding protein
LGELRLQGVEKRFGDVIVVRDLSLTIKDREFFTFVGPSGCGKSTILNMIAGLEELSGGDIYFDGAPVGHLSPGERDVAMVFQSYALYPHMSVYDNIAFPLKVKKKPLEKIDTEVKEAAAQLGLESLLHRRPKELSGGQRQRVALGRAIVRRPKAFLMDEPLSNLDARLRVEMRAELKRIHRQCRITTVYVTHDQEEALALSDRIAVLHDGKIQQCGPPLEVYAKPANLFVAGFIGSPPMNFLYGALLSEVPSLVPLLKGLDERELVVGVRPSDVLVSMRDDSASLEAEVSNVEPAGSDVWVDGLWGGTAIRGRANPEEKILSGQKAFFIMLPEKLHFFDKATGERIS